MHLSRRTIEQMRHRPGVFSPVRPTQPPSSSSPYLPQAQITSLLLDFFSNIPTIVCLFARCGIPSYLSPLNSTTRVSNSFSPPRATLTKSTWSRDSLQLLRSLLLTVLPFTSTWQNTVLVTSSQLHFSTGLPHLHLSLLDMSYCTQGSNRYIRHWVAMHSGLKTLSHSHPIGYWWHFQHKTPCWLQPAR